MARKEYQLFHGVRQRLYGSVRLLQTRHRGSGLLKHLLYLRNQRTSDNVNPVQSCGGAHYDPRLNVTETRTLPFLGVTTLTSKRAIMTRSLSHLDLRPILSALGLQLIALLSLGLSEQIIIWHRRIFSHFSETDKA